VAFLRENPLRAAKALLWLRQGKQTLKAELAPATILMSAYLPYDQAVID